MLQYPSLDSLLYYVNLANATAYTLTDLLVSKPQVVSGSWHEQVTQKNTVVRLSAAPGSPYKGNKQVVYDRLNLANLAGLKGFSVYAYQIPDVHSLIPAIANYTGLHFSTADLNNVSLVDNGDGNLKAVLTAHPDSIAWIGSVELIVKPGGVPLDAAVTVPNLPGLNYPTANDQDTFGAVYLYGYDFTTYFNDIALLGTGVLSDTNADKLVAALKATDISSGAALWTNTDGVTAWNLKGATVVSNGLNSSSLPTNQAYKYVLALNLASGVLTPAGTMYLHYNDPFDPSAT